MKQAHARAKMIVPAPVLPDQDMEWRPGEDVHSPAVALQAELYNRLAVTEPQFAAEPVVAYAGWVRLTVIVGSSLVLWAVLGFALYGIA